MAGKTNFAAQVAAGLFEGKNALLNSNKAINNVYDFLLGTSDQGLRRAFEEMGGGQKIGDALKAAYTKNGKLNMTAIAGSYITASAVGRIATGGGLMKDQNGNSNIIGVPFV